MKKLFLIIMAVVALAVFAGGQEVYAEEPDGCSLLNDPEIRVKMSNALEMKLMIQCGEISQEELDQRRSEVSDDASVSPPSEIGALGADIPVSNPAMDTGGTTQSESSIVVVGSVVCAAWNDSGEGYGANGFSGFASSSNGGLTFTDHGPFPNGPGDGRPRGAVLALQAVRQPAGDGHADPRPRRDRPRGLPEPDPGSVGSCVEPGQERRHYTRQDYLRLIRIVLVLRNRDLSHRQIHL